MEDRFNIVYDLEHTKSSIYGIFDGHGGEVSKIIRPKKKSIWVYCYPIFPNLVSEVTLVFFYWQKVWSLKTYMDLTIL